MQRRKDLRALKEIERIGRSSKSFLTPARRLLWPWIWWWGGGRVQKREWPQKFCQGRDFEKVKVFWVDSQFCIFYCQFLTRPVRRKISTRWFICVIVQKYKLKRKLQDETTFNRVDFCVEIQECRLGQHTHIPCNFCTCCVTYKKRNQPPRSKYCHKKTLFLVQMRINFC